MMNLKWPPATRNFGRKRLRAKFPDLGDEALRTSRPTASSARRGSEARRHPRRQDHAKSETDRAGRRLLRAIFGEKAADVKDTSVESSVRPYGIVMDVKVSSKKDGERTANPLQRGKRQRSRSRRSQEEDDELSDQLTER